MSARAAGDPIMPARPFDRRAIDAVVTYHLDSFRSGVARFNEILAQRLHVPLVALHSREAAATRSPLLSFKVDELDPVASEAFEGVVRRPETRFELFLHSYSALPREKFAIRRAVRVWCGNHEIAHAVQGLNACVKTLWTPGLVLDQRVLGSGEISVFSFGMAHKIQTDRFRRLRELLEATERSYVVYVSTAIHETSSMRDAQDVYEEMHEIFPRELYFMGHLSDVAVSNYLRSSTLFAAFFPMGVRDNNTSIASAMEHGCVVITNLDRFSPRHLRHMENMLDIDQCRELPSDPLALKRMSVGAMETARARDWDDLARQLRPSDVSRS
ncbi:MAG: hypothetical protein WKF94_08895 [Solirubrobacteraceae bacterium]